MTYTETEIETALSWHRRTNGNYAVGRETLWNAARRTGINGSYDVIAENILRTTIAELSALANARAMTPGANENENE